MNALDTAIEALYEAFRDVPKPRKIEGCPCCIEDKDVGTLLSKPLRELTALELSSYSESAFLTVGTVADYLYFLPRIIEVAARAEGAWPDIVVTGRAVGETRPSEWPRERREALIQVIRSVIGEAIERQDGRTIDGWICAAAKMGLDVTSYLGQVAQSASALQAYYEVNSAWLIKGKFANEFNRSEDKWQEKILKWFASPEINRKIADCYGLSASDGEA